MGMSGSAGGGEETISPQELTRRLAVDPDRGAPGGAKRKEMTDMNISSVPAGMPAPGCCSGSEKLGTAEARDRAPEVKRPDNVTAGRHCQTPACVLARPKGRAKAIRW